ncbi:MAG: PASTA domain-containing protein [Nitrosomonas sp.]|uniref:PASTA domain-containing protein n=1 Tax=Nitrosomonas sp. TaxID=42353 RepID=UPI0032EB0245
MASIVEITQASDVVTCDENGQAVIGFSINNKNNNSPRQRRVGFRINVVGETKQSWFEIEGKKELTLDIDATAEVKVRIAAAGALPDHIYKFSLLVFDVTNMDEDYTESKVIALRIAAKKEEPIQPEPKSKKWLIWLIVGVVTILLAGVITFVLLKDKPSKPEPANVVVPTPTPTPTPTLIKMPDVMYKTLSDTKNLLQSSGFTKIDFKSEFDLSRPEGTILNQSIAAGTDVDPKEVVIVLTTANHGVKVPDLTNLLTIDAFRTLNSNHLNGVLDTNPVRDSKLPESTVVKQDPPSGASVAVDSKVKLTVSTREKEIRIWAVNILPNLGMVKEAYKVDVPKPIVIESKSAEIKEVPLYIERKYRFLER